MQNMFIMDPLNQSFVDKTRRSADDPAMTVALVILMIFILPMIGLNGVMIAAWVGQSGAIHPGLVVVTLVTLGVDAVLLAAGLWYRKRWMLSRHGQLISGEMTHVEAEARGHHYMLTVRYTFQSPQTSGTISGITAAVRDDLNNDQLPTVETPVTILYLNDKNYRVM